MITFKCCKSCKTPERHPGCGDICILYRAERKERDQANAKRYEENKVDQYVRTLIGSNRQKSFK